MTNVALMRLPSTEVAMVRSLMNVVASRGLAYTLAENVEQSASAELVIVDADNHVAMTMFDTLRQHRRGVIGIMVTRGSVSEDDGQIWIRRPLNSMKLLTALGKADMLINPGKSAVRNRNRNAIATSENLQGARVLVIDASAALRKQMVLALRVQGVQVFTAESGEAGLHILSRNYFDIVILDAVLPGADGYQICKTIKKNRQNDAVTVIMLSSNSSALGRFKARLAGCDAYLAKPVEFRRLIDVLCESHAASQSTSLPRAARNAREPLSSKTTFQIASPYSSVG